ncbi:MAG: NAD(P)-dependent oxidoreductase [Betaproteobacteria bacterium]|nr:NAD(P)-dependent oxidoreductase [Betaproteobacteria bacterium]
MSNTTIALLHPGDMGSAIGACAVRSGHKVLCALEGRSIASKNRANVAGMQDAGNEQTAVRQAAVVLSVCPPHGALDLARRVAGFGFRGLFVDANAIAPATARAAAKVIEDAGGTFVDGGIVGAPPAPGKSGCLYLSGAKAPEVMALFEGSDVKTIDMNGPVGKASAFKACFASWTKGTWALLASIYAVAQSEGVDEALRAQWSQTHPDLAAQLDAPSLNPAKAWRWISEMEEISLAYKTAGMPEGFFLGAADLYRRLAQYKDDPSQPSIDKVSAALRRPV